MTSVYVIICYNIGHNSENIVKAFTSLEEANRYSALLNDEKDIYLEFYVKECGLYNKIEDIDG